MRQVLLLPLFALAGCVSTVGHVVTAPVRATSWTVDKMTTSQAEADRNRGRKMRKDEAKQRHEARKREKERENHPREDY